MLPPAPAMPAHLPHLLQAGRESSSASCEDSDPQPQHQGGRAVFCRARAAARRRHVRSCCLWLLAGFPGSSPRLTELLVREHVVFLPGLAAACQLRHKHSPVSRAPPRPLLTLQLCSLRCSGLATPQLGKQELILPHQPGALQPQLPKARSAPLFFSPVNLPFIIQQI